MLKAVSTLAVSAALATTAAAQTPVDARILPHGEVRPGTYDLATGRATLQPTPGTFSGTGPTLTYDNDVFVGSFAAPGSSDVEWVDWGKLDLPADAGGFNSPPVTEFVIGYATSVPDAAGGVVDIEIGFFTEAAPSTGAVGDCNQANYPGVGRGVEVARFTITGLPGDTTPGDNQAAAYAFAIEVPADQGFGLQEGSVGIGYRFLTDPTATGVLLTTPADTTGCFDPSLVPGVGTSDCFDVYDVAGTTFTCNTGGPFFFGDGLGSSAGLASFYFAITQEVTDAVPGVVRTGSVPNAGTLTPVVDVFVTPCGSFSPSGQPCPEVTITPGASAIPAVSFWALSSTSLDLLAPPIGTVLIGITGVDPFLVLSGTPGSSITLGDTPANASFIGVPIFTQGGTVFLSGQIELTNALDFVIGGVF
jgi:hypothetical protein